MAQRAAYLAPPSLEAAFALAKEDRALKSPWARLKRVQEAEELHRKVGDPLLGYKPHYPGAEAALAEGAWPDGDDLTSKCWHPLLRACARGYELKSSFDAAKFLVARGASVTASQKGMTALHWLALRHDSGIGDSDDGVSSSDVAAFLIDRGADACALDAKGRPPLFGALGDLGRELWPPTPTTMERLVGDAPGDEETVDDNGSALKVGLVETLLARAPRCCTQVPPGVDAPAVAQAWARAGDDVESEPESDDGKGFDQEKWDRKWAVRRKNELCESKVRVGRALLKALAAAADEKKMAAARRADVK